MKDQLYVIVEFPEVQKLQEKEGFLENACLINDTPFMEKHHIDGAAFFVNKQWLEDQPDNIKL